MHHFSFFRTFVPSLLAGVVATSTCFATEEVQQNSADSVSDQEKNIADPKPVQPPTGKLPSDLVVLGDGKYFSPYALLVDKSARTLTIWKHDGQGGIQFVEAFATDIGKNAGAKQARDDYRTPEGIYFFQQTLAGKDLNFDEYGQRAFTTNYPNFFDLLEKKTGSGIWLHAIPDTKSLWRGSRGCVVVRNDVIPLLEKYIQLQKTPLIIRDSVHYMDKEGWESQRRQLVNWVAQWKAAWEAKNIDSYISHYDPEFRSLGMNKSQWREYKNGLNSKYKSIAVKVYQPVMFRHQDEMIVRFLQHYESDALSDFGEKNLFIRLKDGQSPQILGETWAGLPQDMLAAIVRPTSLSN